MRIFRWMMVLVMTAVACVSVRAQDAASLKGEYVGEANGVSYLLLIDPSGSTESEGMVTALPASDELKVLKKASTIKCYGFLEMIKPDSRQIYNIVAFDEGDEEMVPELIMIEQHETDVDEGVVTVDLFQDESDGSIVISDSRDIEQPLFENLTLKKTK